MGFLYIAFQDNETHVGFILLSSQEDETQMGFLLLNFLEDETHVIIVVKCSYKEEIQRVGIVIGVAILRKTVGIKHLIALL